MKPRRFSQTLSLLLLHASWGPEFKWFCNPVLSCHSCALSWFACPIGVFVHYAGYQIFPFLAVGTVLLIGILFGRLLCGWVCPFGFLQDLLHKIPSRKFRLPAWTSYIKYVVLVVMVLLLPYLFGELTYFSFCRVCPASALQYTIPALITGAVETVTPIMWVRLGLLAAILLFVVSSSRAFCKTICPIGALLAPLNHVSFWFVRMPEDSCASCGKCDRICTMHGEPSSRIGQGIEPNRLADCVVCHECQTACPERGRTPKDAAAKGA